MTPLMNAETARLDPVLAALTAGAHVGGGRFTLIRPLGQGGMGVVWLARDDHLREEVALKFLPPEIRHDAVALDDLRRETSRSRKLTHPNIIRIHDLYRSEEEAFISMEFVDGSNLSEYRLDQPQRVLTWTFLAPLVKQLCDALAYAHGENIVHRDLKPANMMIDKRGRLKLADFGIAATVSDSVSRVSMGRHALSGTASYMSPQQLDGELPQTTDDIYSLGSTLYELLASRAPFFTGDIAHQVRSLPPQPLEKRIGQLQVKNPVPPAVCATIMACLEKQPGERPQTAQEVAESMGLVTTTSGAAPTTPATGAAAAESRKPTSSPIPVPAETAKVTTQAAAPQPATTAAPLATAAQRDGDPSGNNSTLTTVFVAIAVVGLAGLILWSSQRRRPVNVNPQGAPPTSSTSAPAPSPAAPPTPVPVPQFVDLFNGRDFTGWDGDPAVWSVKDGRIIARGAKSEEKRPVALFWRGEPIEDFELEVSFKLETGNSGIYYRAKKLGGYEVGGYQFEISGPNTGTLLETGADRLRRDLGRRGYVTTARLIDGKDKISVMKTTDASALEVRNAYRYNQWNNVLIIARGNHIIQKLNGHTIVEVFDEFEQRPLSGTIALEAYGKEGTTVHFRDIRLKRLPPENKEPAKQK